MFDSLQLNTERTRYIGISAQHLDCEVNLVSNTLAGAMAAVEQFKIFQTIVGLYSIFVMYSLFAAQFATEVLFHYVAVFQDFLHRVSIRCWNSNHHVPAPHASSDFEQAVFLAVNLTDPFVFALFRAQLLLAIYATALVTVLKMFFAAVNADKFAFGFVVFSASDERTSQRTVPGVASELFTVCTQVGLHHYKGFVALLASEAYRRATRCVRVFVQVRTAASETTVFASLFGFARVAKKRLVAGQTNFLDSHWLYSFGWHQGQSAVAIRDCQATLA